MFPAFPPTVGVVPVLVNARHCSITLRWSAFSGVDVLYAVCRDDGSGTGDLFPTRVVEPGFELRKTCYELLCA